MFPGPYYGLPYVYPASMLQPGQPAAAAAGGRPGRPVTPGGSGSVEAAGGAPPSAAAAGAVPYMIPAAIYDQNGLVVGGLRGVGNGGPVRLVSPAPVIINSGGAPGPLGNSLRMLGSQGPQIGTPPSVFNGSAPNFAVSSAAATGAGQCRDGMEREGDRWDGGMGVTRGIGQVQEVRRLDGAG